MMITWTAGILMIVFLGIEWFKSNYWLHAKLLLLIALTAYHLHAKKTMARLAKGEKPMNSFRFRLYNEVPTILLFLIVELAVLKNISFPNYLVYTMLALLPLLYLGTVQYPKKRMAAGEKE